jgi:hypothetical protein
MGDIVWGLAGDSGINSFFTGSIAEWIIITNSITNQDMNNLHNYFTSRYGTFV